MNTPNKLTLLRIILIPIFLFCMLSPQVPHNYLLALIVFVVASLTDLLDGHLARKHGLVTDFGKLMDPLADKLLVTSALISFVGLGVVPSIICVVIIAREFVVTSIRLIGAQKGRVIAADIYGKVKTVFQMVWMCFLMFWLWTASQGVLPGLPYDLVHTILMTVTTVFTVFSGGNYVWLNRDLFADR